MKTLIISLSLFFSVTNTWAQTSGDTIVVAPGTSGMYFYHILQKGESLQSVSRQFGVGQQKLAALNDNKSPKPYELIKIPLNKNNIIQSGNASAYTNLTPLYHKVLKGETLFRVGKLYGDIPLSSLRSWNHLQGNSIGVGQYLVVGWLKKQPAIAATDNTTPASPQPNTPPSSSGNHQQSVENHTAEGNAFLREVIYAEKNRVKNDKPSLQTKTSVADPLFASATNDNAQQQKPEEPPVVSKPLLASPAGTKENIQTGSGSATTGTPTQTKDLVKVQPSHQNSTQSKPEKEANPFEKMLNTIAGQKQKQQEAKKVTPPVVRQTPQTTTPAIQNNTPVPTLPSQNQPAANVVPNPTDQKDTAKLQLSRESIFTELFLAQTQGEKLTDSKKGAAGWFKSNVKPGSKKYYALCNDLPRGTIVKVVNPINKKFVYVKVLAPIPQQKENYNLIIKLSDAAMNDLGTSQPRFWSKIIYPHLNKTAAN